VAYARGNMGSPAAALYVSSLNAVIDIHALRKAVALEAHVPMGIWWSLWSLIVLGLVAMGYQTAVAESRRSLAMFILAIAFSLVIALIASLDRPQSRFIRVSQQPFRDLQLSMSGNASPSPSPGEAP